MFNVLDKYMTDVLMYLPRTNIQKKKKVDCLKVNMIGVFLTPFHQIFLTFLFPYLYFHACHFKFLLFFSK